ncbi:uncharacterized protein LOC132564719 [Ylistrum balloti]|uniref:uncharacterized protein LOC132564719 n=1 Tax=Ylistrum balloti TaxID=509963 RepID=UPI002905C5E5|nr:uncharacterized protein LOC132564719 [Ylistrum balloti]
MTLTSIQAAGSEGPSIGPLIGGISGSAIGLIVIVVVAIVIYKRKTTDKNDDMEMINNSRHSSADDDSDGLKRNILYESSDGLKSNILYESAGANYQPAPGPSSEYAIVCKPNKKNGAPVDPNSVYAVVDKTSKGEKDSKNDLYAEVMKQPKGKGGKGKKKPREEPKQGKGRKKNKKADHGNERDVYENAHATAEDDQLYANEVNTSKPEQGPSRKRNQDGLLYLEVEFKDDGSNGRRAVIHGIENRNDYADIDFTKRADPLPDQDDPEKNTAEADGKAKRDAKD